MRNNSIGRARCTDTARQSAGIDAGQADLAVCCHPFCKMLSAAEIARRSHVFAGDAANRCFYAAFQILVIGADIADMRECEGDDLRGIAGIGHDLLIACDRSIEAHFAHCIATGSKAPAPDHRAIGQNADSCRIFGLRRSGCGVGHWALRLLVFSDDVAKRWALSLPCPDVNLSRAGILG